MLFLFLFVCLFVVIVLLFGKCTLVLVIDFYLVFFAPHDQHRCCDQMETVVQQ